LKLESSRKPTFFQNLFSLSKNKESHDVPEVFMTPDDIRPSAPLCNFDFDLEDHKLNEVVKSSGSPLVNINRSLSFGDKDAISALVQQTTQMAKIITKSNEKDEIGKVKISNIEFEDLHKFLSSYTCDSELSAVFQFPKDLRVPMEKLLKVPKGISLINYYKDSSGDNQRFINDITSYLISFPDFNIVSIIKSHDISKASDYNVAKIYGMLQHCEQELLIFDSQVNPINILEIKKCILANLGPKVFLDYVTLKYEYRILSDHCSISTMIELVEEGMSSYSSYKRLQKEMNATQSKININTSDSSDKKDKKEEKKRDKKDEKNEEKKYDKKDQACWNCDKSHRLRECPEVCRIHNKKCTNIFACLKIDRANKDLNMYKNDSAEINICLNPDGCKCSNIIDTGASATATFNKALFNDDSILFDTKVDGVEVGNGATIDIVGKGTIGNKRVHFVPGLNKTVIASDVMLSDDRVTIIRNDELIILKDDIEIKEKLREIEKISKKRKLLVARVERENGVYPMTDDQVLRVCTSDKIDSVGECLNCNATYFTVENSKLSDEMLFWHKNWDHASKKQMISIVENKIFKNIPKNLTVENINKHLPVCISCPFGNMRAKSIPVSSETTYAPGDCAVGDIKHMDEPDIDGNNYLALFIDMGSDKVFDFKLKRLDNLVDIIIQLNNLYKSHGHKMKRIRLDVQFLTKEISDYLSNAGPKYEKIDQEHPAPYEHGQNGKAENIIQKIENSIQKVLKDSSAPKEFWGPISSNICKTRNTMNSHKNLMISRNEAFGGSKTDLLVTPMIPWGSKVLAHIPVKHQTALGYKCFPTMAMGPADGVKGGIVLRNLTTNKNITRRTFKVLGPGSKADYDSSFDLNIEIEPEEILEDIEPSYIDNSTGDLDRKYFSLNRNSAEVNNKNKHYFNYKKLLFDDDLAKTSFKVVDVVKENKAKGPGSKTLYFKYYDTILYPGGPTRPVDFEYTPCSELLKDKHIKFDSINNRDLININTIVNMKAALRVYRTDFKTETHEPPPNSVAEARVHPEQGYFKAFLAECESFSKYGVDIPPDIDIKDIDPALILQLIPLFQKKFNGANFDKFKCRMIVLGNKWKNIHQVDTYASMAKIDTLKLMLAIGASLDWDMVKFDVKVAYLTTVVEPQHRYYVRRPPGARNEELPYISQPDCYIYGHPLANESFQKKLDCKLREMGATATLYDPNLYLISNDFGKALISTIVDDMPTPYSGGKRMLDFLKENLGELFDMTCDDPLTTAFGMEVTRDRSQRTIKLKQRGSQINLFNKHLPSWEDDDIDSFAKIPKNPNGPLSQRNTELNKISLDENQTKLFQSIVGELNWITNTAPDFMYAVRCSARCMINPTAYDMKELKQIVSCMAGIVRSDKDGLILGGPDIDLVFTTDTSYHGFDDLKSCTGVTIHLNSKTGSISSMSEKQKLTTDSAMASEGVGSHLHI
jgi:hypothetical protein